MPITIAPEERADALIRRAVRKSLDGRAPRKSKTRFLRFLNAIESRSDLLCPDYFRGRADGDWSEAILNGLVALFVHRKSWLRPVERWNAPDAGPVPGFSTLAHHLLARYPVPPVLLSTWFLGDTRMGHWQQCWFKHAGSGKSLRAANFPIRLTRRMAHEFARAPADYPVRFALRWAQVRGMGGTDGLARAVAGTRLGTCFGRAAFWTSVIQLFINKPEADPDHVRPIVEYLYHQKFAWRTVVIGEDTEIYLDPPKPGLSIKGRTVASLLRNAVEWRGRNKETAERVLVRWDRSDIREFRERDEQGRLWSVRELLDSDELAAEGKAMDHCVATYTQGCSARATTIWSIEIASPDGRKRAATVEVDPEKRTVVQAKAQCNRAPDDACLAILKQWADREGLKPAGAREVVAAAINDG